MTYRRVLPRLLIIDDLFGRTHPDHLNRERANLCAQYLLRDVTGDEGGKGLPQQINDPTAEVVFCRGQKPRCSVVGDTVENDLEGTLSVIQEGWDRRLPETPCWAMVLLDLHFYTGRVTATSDARTRGMPEGRSSDNDPRSFFGLKLLETIKERFKDLPVVILSSKPRQDVSEDFTKKGAVGFLPRSDEQSPERLIEYIRKYGLIPDDSGKIVGYSKPLLLVLQKGRMTAMHRHNILIQGERGTGKELLARYIHEQTATSQSGPFIEVDSGALSPELYASELFGHKRGAFTGADRDRVGRIQQADGGELFLDEIGNMPPEVQMGLLRVTEQGVVTPLGSQERKKVNVRFITATNEDMEEKAASGRFKQDLFDRLKDGGTLQLVPLRERLEDLDLLVMHLVRDAEQAFPRALRREVHPDSIELLRSYDWPGNIRELRSCIYDAVFSYPDVEYLQPTHLHFGGGARRLDPRGKTTEAPGKESGPGGKLALSLGSLIEGMQEVLLEQVNSEELTGKLPQLQEAYARLFLQLLRSAILATNKRTALDNPQAKLSYHPAMKLLTGDNNLSATDAIRTIKRQLKLFPEAEAVITNDPVLSKALNKLLFPLPPQDDQIEG
jgi:Response regulator containing CheY-like receiver, AAA-type ATPase, and DNA-binding domains